MVAETGDGPELVADLVLEGGGVKGIGLVGAISVLEERGYRFRRVAGTSAGSIVGALVAAGFSADKLRDLMTSIDYTRFRDETALGHLGAAGRAVDLLVEHGLYKGAYARQWIREQLESQHVATFADLADDDPDSALPAEQRFRLVVMASDVSNGCLVRFPWHSRRYGRTPAEQPVDEAVRASMSIPYFYEPVELPDAESGGKAWLVDGGMLSNFPIDVFDRPAGQRPRWPTFGIKLSARPVAHTEPHPVKGTVSLTEAMLGTMTGWYDQMHLDDPGTLARTMFVDTTGVKATDFGIDRDTQDRLYQNGRKAAEGFLATWDFDAYVARYRTAAAGG